MKKLMFCLFLILMLVPISVYGNDGPHFDGYDVIVSNPEGAKTYVGSSWDDYDTLKQSDDIVSFNTELVIGGEFSGIDGIVYGYVSGKDYYVDLSDVALVKSDKSVNDKDVERLKRELYVYSDAKLFAGPSVKYDIVTTIPKGTILNSKYSASTRMWSYVEYNEYKGWVYVGGYARYSNYKTYENLKGVAVVSPKAILFFDDIEFKLYDSPSEYSSFNECSVDSNRLLNVKYSTIFDEYYMLYNDSWFYIDESLCSGWLNRNELSSNIAVLERIKGNLLLFDDKLYAYTSFDDAVSFYEKNKASDTILSFNKNDEVEYDYYYLGMMGSATAYYIKYDDNFYWAIKEDNLIATSPMTNKYYKTESEIEVYEDPFNGKIIGKIESDQLIVNIKYEYDQSWIYLDNIKGWIKIKDLKELSPDEYEQLIDSGDVTEEKLIVLNKKMKGVKKILLYAIIGVVILSIVTVIAIYLFNKKKIKYKV